ATTLDLHSLPTRRSSDLDPGQLLNGGIDSRLRQLDILQLAGEVRVVRRHVEVAVAGQSEEDHPVIARLASGGRLLGYGPQSVGRSEEHTSELQSPYDLVC